MWFTVSAISLTSRRVRCATCTRFSPGCSSSLAKVRVNTELGLSSLFDSRSSAVCRGPAENTENTPSGNCVIGASPPPPATRAGAGALERIVAAGVEHQDRGAHILVLQPLDDAVGEHGGVAHQLFLAFARRRHVGRQQEVLAGDLKAVAGIEEERGIAGLRPPCRTPTGVSLNACRVWFSATITVKPSCLSVSPMVRASLTAFCSLGTFL